MHYNWLALAQETDSHLEVQFSTVVNGWNQNIFSLTVVRFQEFEPKIQMEFKIQNPSEI